MITEIRHVLLWPLRSAGLDPGRALANASPSPEQREAAQLELWEHVQIRFPAQPTKPAEPIARHATTSRSVR